MNKLFFSFVIIILPLYALSDEINYNSVDGKCYRNGAQVALRATTLNELLRTRNAECADLSGIVLRNIQGDAAKGWNFKGADLNNAQIIFSYFFESNFSGTKTSQVGGSYISLEGIYDSFTNLPSGIDWNCNQTPEQLFHCDR